MKKRKSEAEKLKQRARTPINKARTQERIAKRLLAAKARRERKLIK